jgi:hypothetical protein
MAAYATTISALSSTSYPAGNAPQIDLPDSETADEVFAALDTAATVVALSFDGVVDHIRLDATNYRTHQRIIRHGKIWARSVSGAAATLHVQSWTHK